MNILLIGAGYHARRIYIPFFMKEQDDFTDVHLACGVDLVSQKPVIETWLSDKHYKLPMTYFHDGLGDDVIPANNKILQKLIREHEIDSVIIATEPLAHFKYAKWALENNLNILMDKPITSESDVSMSEHKAKKLAEDYLVLKKLYFQKKQEEKVTTFSLLSQRRFHPAYKLIKQKLDEVRALTNCPVTSIQASHSDGQWRLPTEIIEQNYHPYNQGYGKCSHSGYHTLDIVTWLVTTQARGEKTIDSADVYASFVRPSDFDVQLNFEDYRRLFPDFDVFNKYTEAEFVKKVKRYGELDAFCEITFKRKDATVCLGSLNLIHNGFSQRNWVHAIGRDLYKGNGRVRQEMFFLEQGPFQSIAFISYQSREISPQSDEGLYDMGGEYHLDVHVFRNSNLFPEWKTYEKFDASMLFKRKMEGYSRGHQEDARRDGIIDFIHSVQTKTKSESDLLLHENSTNILSAIYLSNIAKLKGENPVISIPIIDYADPE